MKLIDKAIESMNLSDEERDEVISEMCPGDLYPELTEMELCTGSLIPGRCRECWNQEIKEAA